MSMLTDTYGKHALLKVHLKIEVLFECAPLSYYMCKLQNLQHKTAFGKEFLVQSAVNIDSH